MRGMSIFGIVVGTTTDFFSMTELDMTGIALRYFSGMREVYREWLCLELDLEVVFNMVLSRGESTKKLFYPCGIIGLFKVSYFVNDGF